MNLIRPLLSTLLCSFLYSVSVSQNISCGKLLSTESKLLSPYVKYTQNGQTIWEEHNNQGGLGWAISIDCKGSNCATAGFIKNNCYLFDLNIVSHPNSNNGFLIAFNPSGTAKWHFELPTFRASSITSVLTTQDAVIASGHARGNVRDLVDLDIPRNYYSALLYKFNAENGDIQWRVNIDALFGGTVVEDSKGNLYWATASANPEVGGAYYSQVHKINAETGEILWTITNDQYYFLADDRPHSQISLSIDDQDNPILSQIQAHEIIDSITQVSSWQKQLNVMKYDGESQKLTYQKIIASQAGIANTISGNYFFYLRDSKSLPDGSLHIATLFKRNELSIYPTDQEAYTETNNGTVDICILKLDANGNLIENIVYGKENDSWANYLSTDKDNVNIGGCYFTSLKVNNQLFEGIDDRNIFHVAYEPLPEARNAETNIEFEESTGKANFSVTPNPVARDGAIQINYPLEVGVHYELSAYKVEGTTNNSTIASFTLSQSFGNQNALYVPINMNSGLYILTLRGNGEIKETTKLWVE